MPLNVLIVGAGVCGPALATLLQRSDHRHRVTVIERFPSLRVSGLQLDLKGQGTPIARKMGILDTIKSHLVNETGLEVVDSNGKTIAQFGIVDHSKGENGVTTEYEIMRSDLARVLYQAGLDHRAKLGEEQAKEGALNYEFDKTITELSQTADGVEVTFTDGQIKHYDIVVAADGQGSRTRRLAFGQETSDEAFKSLGIHAAYFTIPRIEGEGSLAKRYIGHDCRAILTRNGDRPMTQVYLLFQNKSEKIKQSYMSKEPIEKQKEAWTERFKGAGWQTERLLSGMHACDDFYAHEIAQVKMKQVYTGRVVLVGDAGYCPSLFSGMGTTAALVGAYVLAGELARHGNDVDAALKKYEEVIRTPIDQYQNLVERRTTLPSSHFAVWLMNMGIWATSRFKIADIARRFMPSEKPKPEWTIPDYPELNLAE